MFGWKQRKDGLRRFRTVFIELPRKNGKSTFASGTGLYLLIGDGEPGAEVYSAATKRDQAKITWSEAARMVKASPALKKRITVFKDNLSVEANSSKYEPLGADADTLDGLNIHGAIIDELHAHRTRAVVDVLETATGARRQPLQFEITTAGYNQNSVCFEHYVYSKKILSGSIQDDTWFAFVAELDEGDDWRDERAWAKANPNLNVSVKPDDLRRKADKAAKMPTALNAFLRLHLNRWTQQNERAIDLALWDENTGAPWNLADLEGCECYGGLDLSSVSDLTAWVLAFPDGADGFWIAPRFWCPEDRLDDPHNQYADQYKAWHAAGLLETTPGNAVDYGFVMAQVLEDAGRFALRSLNVDRLFQGYQLMMALGEELGEGVVFGMGQGFMSMGPAWQQFERLLLAKKLHHGGHPVLRWMADNVSVRLDPAGNRKPDKAKSQGRIDGIVALLMALDRALRQGDEGGSVYDERELLIL